MPPSPLLILKHAVIFRLLSLLVIVHFCSLWSRILPDQPRGLRAHVRPYLDAAQSLVQQSALASPSLV